VFQSAQKLYQFSIRRVPFCNNLFSLGARFGIRQRRPKGLWDHGLTAGGSEVSDELRDFAVGLSQWERVIVIKSAGFGN